MVRLALGYAVDMPVRAAIGVRVKTGRATAIVVAGSAAEPRAISRHALELWDPDVPDSKAPYHAGLPLDGEEARVVVEHACEAARAVALRVLQELVAALRADGIQAADVALVVGSDADPAKLGNPHVRAHASEGRLFREVLEDAARACGLPSRAIVERDLYAEAEKALGRSAEDLRRAVTSLGASLGRPWRAEEKTAALAAWLTLD